MTLYQTMLEKHKNKHMQRAIALYPGRYMSAQHMQNYCAAYELYRHADAQLFEHLANEQKYPQEVLA